MDKKVRPEPRRIANPEPDYGSKFIGFYLDTPYAYGYVDTPSHWKNAISAWAEDKNITQEEACKRLLATKECDYADIESHSPDECYKCFGTINKAHTGKYTLRHHFEDQGMEEFII